MSDQERIKFQGMIPKGLRREIEVQWNKGYDPTLLVWNDVVQKSGELVLEWLAEQNQSQRGQYVASVFKKKRMKESDELLRKAEYEIAGYEPREDFDKEGS